MIKRIVYFLFVLFQVLLSTWLQNSPQIAILLLLEADSSSYCRLCTHTTLAYLLLPIITSRLGYLLDTYIYWKVIPVNSVSLNEHNSQQNLVGLEIENVSWSSLKNKSLQSGENIICSWAYPQNHAIMSVQFEILICSNLLNLLTIDKELWTKYSSQIFWSLCWKSG